MRGYSRPASTIQAVELLSLHINHLKCKAYGYKECLDRRRLYRLRYMRRYLSRSISGHTDRSRVKEGVDFNDYEEGIKEAAESCPVSVIKYD